MKTDLIGKQIPILDKGWIELQDIMGDDLAIVNAARTSFLGDSKGPEQDKRLLFYLMSHGHTSPFEQVEIKLRVKAPVVTWWQWARHRTWNFNAQSGRYTEFEEDDFYIPTEWRLQSALNKQGSEGVLDEYNASSVTAALRKQNDDGFTLYKLALNIGIAKEQARLFLPAWCSYYTWVCKVDAHNLMHFLKLRMANEAQYEIRVYAQAIYDNFFKLLLPWTAEAFEKFVLKGE